jgi:NADH dehydrogenase
MIVVAGGSGRLGRELVRRLSARGLPVRVLTRDRTRVTAPGVDVVVADVREPSTLAQAMTGADVAVSAVHGFAGPGGVSPASVDRDGNAHLVDAAKAAGADVVLMSVHGASADNPMELHRMKYSAEQRLRASGVPWTIVRATPFTELWIELFEQTARRAGRPLVFGRGDNRINFVSVGDVAALVELAVTDKSLRGSVLDIGGPDNLTFNQLAGAVQTAAARAGYARHVPRPMLRAMAATVGRFKPALGRQARAALAMDTEDLAFDATALHRRFPTLPTTTVAEVLAG